MAGERIASLLKFGKREHIDQFRKGKLYTRPLKEFVQIEDGKLRGDKREGISHLLQSKRVQITLGHPAGEKHYINAEGGLIGDVTLALDDERERNVYCLYGITDDFSEIPVDERNLQFGDTVLAVMRVKEFFNRITATAKKERLSISGRPVEYINTDVYHGEMGPFRKSSDYAYQCEYGFVFSQPYVGTPRIFDIGDISDISAVFPSASFNSVIEITEVADQQL
jgi:hypothetical protein